LGRSATLALAWADGYGYALVPEHGGDLQVTAERLDVGAGVDCSIERTIARRA
jgi:hypothetical protein